MTNVGRNITMYRREAELPGAQLARDANISKSYLHALEHGGNHSLSFAIALRIAEVLEIDVRQLAVRRTITAKINGHLCWYDPITELWRHVVDDTLEFAPE